MKNNRNYIWTYIFTLIIGVLLLVFTGRTNLFNIIIQVMGALFVIPSVIMLFLGFAGKKEPDGTRQSRPWYVAVTAIGGLILGVLLLVMPGFFSNYLLYTLAIILILEGVAQIINLSGMGNDVGGTPAGWFVMPWLTVAAGVTIIIIGPERIANAITIITGVVMVLYSVNGLMGVSSHHVVRRRLDREEAAASSVSESTSETAETPAEESIKTEQ
ncbi:MAG: DUF308 domain-containing protein [Muribaculaceae bacterium]|nr:DUF308 domain-containing protein [Muribaculaceae bacterium]